MLSLDVLIIILALALLNCLNVYNSLINKKFRSKFISYPVETRIYPIELQSRRAGERFCGQLLKLLVLETPAERTYDESVK